MSQEAKNHILFITGTRADFGKLKPLIHAVDEGEEFTYSIFVTGMHLLSRYGKTYREVVKENFKDIYLFVNQIEGETMDIILANTVSGLSRYVAEANPDMIVVHGDRLEALAGAIVGAFRNILVCHVEGGERSGTIDEMIRHSVTKLSHIHCVANDEAAQRLFQMGENEKNVFVTGSPDIDIMLSQGLPSEEQTKQRYEIRFDEYGIVLYHPVTTLSQGIIAERAARLTAALIESKRNYVVIYPNNDSHSQEILKAFEELEGLPRFQLFPSLRFEYFLSLLKYSNFIIGNSSAGIREAPVYGVPTINLGSRQEGRYHSDSILDVAENKKDILAAIDKASNMQAHDRCLYFGKGDSTVRFMNMLRSAAVWETSPQKFFKDIQL